MRVLLAVIVALGCVGLFAGGIPLAVVGFADQRVADKVYVVGLGHAGDECGAERLELDVEDGVPLLCTRVGMHPVGESEVDLPGFSAEQNDEVAALAAKLGDDGLSPADRRQVQDQVDIFAADVPPDERPYPDRATISWYGLWGARLGWLGVGMAAGPVLLYIVIMRRP